MAILTGRYGTIKYDPAGILPVTVGDFNKWKMSQKTDKTNVSCFGDLNKVYVPGLKDINGSIAGFWNSTNVVLWAAVDAATPGLIALGPNSTETASWSGLAYLDADIDCSVDGAPAVSGSFMAAGTWTRAA